MELTISLPRGNERLGMLGTAEQNLKIIRDALGVNISARDDTLRLSGQSYNVGRAAEVLEHLATFARKGQSVDRDALEELVHATQTSSPATSRQTAGAEPTRRPAPRQQHRQDSDLDVYLPNRHISAATPGQARYLEALHRHDMTFCIGPAGTGKTYLAVAAAVAMLKANRVRKLVLVRPAVEAGEKLGFLPGTMQDKVNPYLRPLLDSLHDMMTFDQIQRFMACDLIEIIPLAFMRGRTLNDSMIILDEAQNATKAQMLMFLTRLGQGSKMVITGDPTQFDLEDPRDSGLIDAARRLRRVSGIAFVTLEQSDIVRHNLVQRIVDAYGQDATRPTTMESGPRDTVGQTNPPQALSAD